MLRVDAALACFARKARPIFLREERSGGVPNTPLCSRRPPCAIQSSLNVSCYTLPVASPRVAAPAPAVSHAPSELFREEAAFFGAALRSPANAPRASRPIISATPALVGSPSLARRVPLVIELSRRDLVSAAVAALQHGGHGGRVGDGGAREEGCTARCARLSRAWWCARRARRDCAAPLAVAARGREPQRRELARGSEGRGRPQRCVSQRG